ncbi:MAG: helicase [Myxococcaceae bacterium]|nr:helicase [Myxococcaceae bacterium]
MPRDERHFDQLLKLLQLERDAEARRLAEERATLSLGELESRGLVLLDLESKEESVGLGGRAVITFVRGDGRPLPASFSSGDLVSVSPRKAEVDFAPSGLVVRATRQQVQVAFDKPPPPWIQEGRLRLDKAANQVTYERIRSAVLKVKGYEHGTVRQRREVLLGRAEPRFERPADFTPTRPLNPEQRDAVAMALAAQDFFLVHGPPGTGKSTVLAEVAFHLAAGGKRLLCTAASNAAVDHLLELCLDQGLSAVRVGHPGRVMPHLQEHTLDLQVEEHPDRILARELFDEAFELLGYARRQRSQGRSRARFSNAREAQGEAKRLMDEARKLERKAVNTVLERSQVVCATCASLDGHVLAGESFDVALLDEATQATEPTALVAFTKAPTVILAGDPQQLSATVLSIQAQAQGLGVSLFERLLEEHGPAVKRLLKEQYRMNQVLMEFPSKQTYGDQLRAHPSVAHRLLELGLEAPPLLFLDTAGKGFDETKAPGTESLRNEGEAGLIIARARALLAAGLPAGELAIISPYRAQAAFIREQLGELEQLEIDTIDAFQGREKDAVLVSLVRSNVDQALGFLTDLRRINVAITRARRHLFVVADSATISAHPYFAALVEYAQAVGGYRSAWEWTG